MDRAQMRGRPMPLTVSKKIVLIGAFVVAFVVAMVAITQPVFATTRDGYRYLTFDRTTPDNNPGRNDWVIGTVSGQRGYGSTRFSFSCSIDFRSGTVRSVDVRKR